jgi:hypothetical protein
LKTEIIIALQIKEHKKMCTRPAGAEMTFEEFWKQTGEPELLDQYNINCNVLCGWKIVAEEYFEDEGVEYDHVLVISRFKKLLKSHFECSALLKVRVYNSNVAHVLEPEAVREEFGWKETDDFGYQYVFWNNLYFLCSSVAC